MLHVVLLIIVLLESQIEAQISNPILSNDSAVKHFGNCHLKNFGPGRCIYRNDCNFYNVLLLDASSSRDCYSQQRPDLICCPREENALPLLAARIDNKTESKATISAILNASPLVTIPLPPSNADELPKHPHCGTAFSFKVYGGNNTELLEFPWTTLLEYTVPATGEKQHICGASFIAQRWLLTAAHCVHQKFLGDGRKLTGARLGEWNQTSNPDCVTHWNGKRECAPPHIEARIDRALMHPQFELGNLTHDIALLRLEQPIDWRQHQHVEPVCLPPVRGPDADQLVGSAVDVSGWGLTEHNNELSAVKRKAMLHVQSQKQCQSSFSSQGYTIISDQLCASGGINIDSCSGDSGGPLTVEAYTPLRDRFVYLVGIVSYGKERCGQTDFPGVYTRVSSYMDWIEQTIRDNNRN